MAGEFLTLDIPGGGGGGGGGHGKRGRERENWGLLFVAVCGACGYLILYGNQYFLHYWDCYLLPELSST